MERPSRRDQLRQKATDAGIDLDDPAAWTALFELIDAGAEHDAIAEEPKAVPCRLVRDDPFAEEKARVLNVVGCQAPEAQAAKAAFLDAELKEYARTRVQAAPVRPVPAPARRRLLPAPQQARESGSRRTASSGTTTTSTGSGFTGPPGRPDRPEPDRPDLAGLLEEAAR